MPATDSQLAAWAGWFELERYRPSRADVYAAQVALYGKLATGRPGSEVRLDELLAPLGEPPRYVELTDGQVEAARREAAESARAARAAVPGVLVTTKTRAEVERDGADFELRERGRRERERRDREDAEARGKQP